MLIAMQRLADEFNVKPKAVLHLGAHLGEEAPDYHAAGVERVLWVEANSDLIPSLTSNVRQYAGQDAVQACISDQDDVDILLRIASFSMSTSILTMKRHLDHYPTILETAAVPMKSITADSLIKQLDISEDTFDMANLDLEGAELLAMRGMTAILPHLKWIYAEVNTEEMYTNCALVGDVDDFLGPLGFKRIATEDAYYLGLYKGFADALYSR